MHGNFFGLGQNVPTPEMKIIKRNSYHAFNPEISRQTYEKQNMRKEGRRDAFFPAGREVIERNLLLLKIARIYTKCFFWGLSFAVFICILLRLDI